MKSKTAFTISLVLLSVGLLITCGPLVWMLITAFTSPEDLATTPPRYGRLSLENFKLILSTGNILRWSFNSFLVATAVTIAQTVFNSLAAFGFSVGRFKGKESLFMLFLTAMMVPGQIVMLPLFLFMAKWNLLDSLWSVILPSMATPFGVYMIRQYMDSIPVQLCEAARIDGANEFQLYNKVYFPLSKPIMATAGIFTFITEWNAFLWPLISLNTEKHYTLTVGLSTLQDQQMLEYGLLMAGATISAIPMVIVFMFFSKFMLEGMRKGAIQ